MSGQGARRSQSAREAATGIETLVARILVVGTYVAVGLILVGVVLMLASGIDPLAPGAFPPFDLASIPGDMYAGVPMRLPVRVMVMASSLTSRRFCDGDSSTWRRARPKSVTTTRPLGTTGAGFYAAGSRRLALVSALVVLVVTLSIIAALQIAV